MKRRQPCNARWKTTRGSPQTWYGSHRTVRCRRISLPTWGAVWFSRAIRFSRPALIQDVEKEGKDGWQVHFDSNHTSLAVVPVSQLPSLLAAWTQEGNLPQEYIEQLPVRSPGQHFLYRLTQQDDWGAVEHSFLLTLENPRDGLVDAYLNRSCSRLLTRLFLRTPLTPNQITILSFLTGLLGASCFLFGSYGGSVLGALLLQFSTVLDCVDGEVARVKMLESPLGEWLDITLDTVVHIAIFLGVGVAVWKQDGLAAAPLLGGLLAAAAFISFPLVTRAEKTENAGRARGGWEDVWIEKMVSRADQPRLFSTRAAVCHCQQTGLVPVGGGYWCPGVLGRAAGPALEGRPLGAFSLKNLNSPSHRGLNLSGVCHSHADRLLQSPPAASYANSLSRLDE